MKTNVRDTSLRALKENGESLGIDQQLVFEAIIELGPTYDKRILEYLRQREAQKSRCNRRPKLWETSDVTGRRNELTKKCMIDNQGLVIDLGAYYGGDWAGNKFKIKKYHFWAARNDPTPVPAGWYKNIEEVPGYKAPKHRELVGAGFKTTLF